MAVPLFKKKKIHYHCLHLLIGQSCSAGVLYCTGTSCVVVKEILLYLALETVKEEKVTKKCVVLLTESTTGVN